MALRIIDRGSGTPVVVIPGVQGRWEWTEPAIDALARRCRVITFSLADEPTSGGSFDERRGFWNYVDQVRQVLDVAGIDRAAICGISYGGLIAAAFAARHPNRVTSLVLVSALPPSWTPDARVRFFLRAPRLLVPLFLIGATRMYPEFVAACEGPWRGLVQSASHAVRALRHMFSPTRMARRARLLDGLDLSREIAAVTAPVLVITGEPRLDRVVPVSATREYTVIWPGANHATLARTGHLGLVTRPDDFAQLVVPFADQAARRDRRRQIG